MNSGRSPRKTRKHGTAKDRDIDKHLSEQRQLKKVIKQAQENRNIDLSSDNSEDNSVSIRTQSHLEKNYRLDSPQTKDNDHVNPSPGPSFICASNNKNTVSQTREDILENSFLHKTLNSCSDSEHFSDCESKTMSDSDIETKHNTTMTTTHITYQPPGANQIFDGQANVSEFFDRFDNYATVFGWNENVKLAQLRFHLTGPALQAYKLKYNTAATYSTMKDHIKTSFSTKTAPEEYRRRLQDRKKTSGESAESYYFDILYLCNKVNPDMTDLEIIEHLIKGLPYQLGKELYFKRKKKPEEILKELIDLSKFESLVGSSPNSEEINNISAVVEQTLRKLKLVPEENEKPVNVVETGRKKRNFRGRYNGHNNFQSRGRSSYNNSYRGNQSRGRTWYNSGQRYYDQNYSQRPPNQNWYQNSGSYSQNNYRGRGNAYNNRGNNYSRRGSYQQNYFRDDRHGQQYHNAPGTSSQAQEMPINFMPFQGN